MTTTAKKEEAKDEKVDSGKKAAPEAAAADEVQEDLAEESRKIIRNHMIVAMGVGIIPLPGVDMLGITAVQLDMLRKLSKTYRVPFPEHTVKSVLGSLIGSSLFVPLSLTLVSFSRFIPLVGTAIAAVTMPVSAGAVTYAVGRVFNQHFASGGTFLTFDPEKVRDYYAEMLKEGAAEAKAAAKS